MPTHHFPRRHAPANGVAARPVPGPLAPAHCVTLAECVSPDAVLLIGRDLSGTVRIKIELSAEDVSTWWIKVVRHWLAWAYGASEIKIVS